MIAADQTSSLLQNLAAIAITTGVAGTILGFVGRLLWRHIKHELGLIRKEITPNGGNTLALGDTGQRTEEKVDELRSLLISHLTNHPAPTKTPKPPPDVPENPTPARKDIEAAAE